MIKSNEESDDDEDNESILVADFGESFITNGTTTRDVGGTTLYMAPERLNPDIRTESNKSDLWSCGVIMFEMIHLRLPFIVNSGDVRNNKYELNFDDTINISYELKPLLRLPFVNNKEICDKHQLNFDDTINISYELKPLLIE